MRMLLLICCVPVAMFAQGHRLLLPGGDRLSGELKAVVDGQWVFEADYVGEVRVPLAEASVTTWEGKPVKAEAFIAKQPAARPSKVPLPELPKLNLPEGWTGEFNVGLVDVRGVSNNRNVNWKSRIAIPYEENTFNWETFYRYAETDKLKSTDAYGTSLRFRHPMDERSFLQSYSVYSEDQIQGVDMQLDHTIGYGYAIIKTERMLFEVVPGLGLQYIDQPGTNDGTSMTWNFYESFEWKLFSNLDFEHSLNFFTPADEISDYSFVFVNGIKTQLSDSYLIRIQHEYDFDNEVAAGLRNYTSTFTTSLGYTF